MNKNPFVAVLGTVQDGGYPHIGASEKKQKNHFQNSVLKEKISCLGVVDPLEEKSFLIDATPHMPYQLDKLINLSESCLSGIFITHTHWGHIGGFGWLSREGLNQGDFDVVSSSKNIEIVKNYFRLFEFKEDISFKEIKDNMFFNTTKNIKIQAVSVPHRAKGDTFGYLVSSEKTIGYFPDCDNIHNWKDVFLKILKEVEVLYLDGTFWNISELENRNPKSIPHPFVQSLIEELKFLDPELKRKIKFIHLNHTNPLLDQQSAEYQYLKKCGFDTAKEGEIVFL